MLTYCAVRRSRTRKGPPPWEKAAAVAHDGDDGQSSAHAKSLSTTQASSQKAADAVEERRRGPRGKLKVPWKLPEYVHHHRPLRFRYIRAHALVDVLDSALKCC